MKNKLMMLMGTLALAGCDMFKDVNYEVSNLEESRQKWQLIPREIKIPGHGNEGRYFSYEGTEFYAREFPSQKATLIDQADPNNKLVIYGFPEAILEEGSIISDGDLEDLIDAGSVLDKDKEYRTTDPLNFTTINNLCFIAGQDPQGYGFSYSMGPKCEELGIRDHNSHKIRMEYYTTTY